MAEHNIAETFLNEHPSSEKLVITTNGSHSNYGMTPIEDAIAEPDHRSSVNVNCDNTIISPSGVIGEDTPIVCKDSNSSTLLLIPLDKSHSETSTTNMQTLMHLLKGNIGTGILALPVAVKHAGLWTGFAGILIIGSIAVHCMHMLLNCSHKLSVKAGVKSLEYADVMEICLKFGPQRGRRFSKASRYLVNALLIFTQLGFCCVYIVFVAANIETVIGNFYKDEPSTLVYQIIVTAALMPLVCVRDLRMMAPFSAFANLLTITGLIIIIQYIVQGLPNVTDRPAFSSFEEIPLFFGTAIFAVEGISLVLPLENSMQKPEDFGGWTGVLNLGMVCIVCMYTAIGFYGYLHFGDTIQDSVTLSLPLNDWLYLSVRLMFAVAIFISYNVQFYVPISITWPSIKQRLQQIPQLQRVVILKTLLNHGEFIFRILLVILTSIVAAVIPHLDLLISLIGAFASSSLALILPSFIEIITLSAAGEHLPKYIIVKNVLIFLFGIVGCVIGTYTSLKAIIEEF